MINVKDFEYGISKRMNGRLNKLFFPLAKMLGEDAKYYVAGNSCKDAASELYSVACKRGLVDYLSIEEEVV